MECVSHVSCSCNTMIIHVHAVKISFQVTLNHNVEWLMFRSITEGGEQRL